MTLATCHFIEHGENLVILGLPGVGKTHLAVGLGLKAIEHGYRVFFTTAATMIATLTRALGEGRLEEKLKVYTVPRLLIIDEIGYLPIDRIGANLFFQLISRRYEKGPMITKTRSAPNPALYVAESGQVKSLREIARKEGVDSSYVRRMVNLTTVAPDIVAAILDETVLPT